ncbi:MAG: acetate--CoA ligase family protein [Proteobacteria bacterium]|nr:acetate--CoA ligase family protein [Pseudomonadota bacterium]MBU1569740.1 acetate--CoA ligase family protein [Pseudomonadota bacterium]
MNITDLFEKINKNEKSALTENESKRILQEYGIPVTEERTATNSAEAVNAAIGIGFPVVLKGLGSSILHKTEMGLVHLNLKDSVAVKEAALTIEKNAGDKLEGFLVQPQLNGKREFVTGMFRDPHFGPVIMFGIGGIFTEAFSDVSFRIAPVTENDAEEMLDEIRAKALLNEFRGEKAVNRKQIIEALTGLSRLALEQPQIAEIDINPLIALPDGNLKAVDALIILGPNSEINEFLPPIPADDIGSVFYPRSIAFVGASSQMGKWGHTLFTLTISGGYEGEIYLVNPKGGTIANRPVYKSVVEIPGKIDLAVVTIPASGVIKLLPDFKAKKIRNVLLITSGFGETGVKGKELEKDLVKAAQDAGILILGPNTMGICNPHINLYCTGSHVRPRPGATAVVAQSGNMGTQLLAFAERQDIGIRAFCGSGNEAMITIEDYIDAFEADNLTRTVMLYVESVKNGRRFFESAGRVGKKKPIVLLKGGRSVAGNRAAASHTGAMTSDSRIFDAVCRQAGIVMVEQPMDLLDLSAAFSSLPLPKGNRAAIMTLGGGWGVVTSDLCSQYGLEVSELSPEMIELMDKILPPYWSRSNPVDIVGENDPSIPMTIIEELLKWDGCDAVINLGILGRRILLKRLVDSILDADPTYTPEYLESVNKTLTAFDENYIKHIATLMEKYNKPVFGVSLLTDEKDKTVYRVSGCSFKGVFYPSPERAVKAFAKMYEYKRFLSRK